MGGLAGEAFAEQIDVLEHYGRAVGLAFQLADDLLDADDDPGRGEPPSSRPGQLAPSYVRLLGKDETLRRARVLSEEAQKLARELPEPEPLVALARFTVEREV
jgi:farnesyl diphosphate synthase